MYRGRTDAVRDEDRPRGVGMEPPLQGRTQD
jgi:hypothetical protein